MIADARGKLKNSYAGDLEFRLIGINHDDKADGKGNAGLTFQGTKAWYSMPVNKTDDNVGGWRDSVLRSFMNSENIWSSLPFDFKNNVASVEKQTNNKGCFNNNLSYCESGETGNVRGNTATIDKLWLASPQELYGDAENIGSDAKYKDYHSGNQYEYWSMNGVTSKNYYKLAFNAIWWLRSPYSYLSDSFLYVYDWNAYLTYNEADHSTWLVPCFSF